MKTSFLSRIVALLAIMLGLVTLGLSSGCVVVAAGAGAGAVAYVRGDLATTLAAGLHRTVQASRSAIQQLAFAQVSEKSDALNGVIIARTAEDKKIEIKLERTGDNLTKIKIRVGVFGDEALSMALLDKIKANL